jgi:pyridoxamine 5'-phosphate oxidase family protein
VDNVFTTDETEYLEGQEIARLATVGSRGMPHVVPVSFELNRELQTIDVGGWKLSATVKWSHVVHAGMAAIVVDDVQPPFRPRFLEVRGAAEPVEDGEKALIRIWPRWIITRGLGSSSVVQRRRAPDRGRVPS